MPTMKERAKNLVYRVMQIGLVDVAARQNRQHNRLAAIEKMLAQHVELKPQGGHGGAIPGEDLAVWRGGLDGDARTPSGAFAPQTTHKLRGEVKYWVDVATGQDAYFASRHPDGLHETFGRWQLGRLRELGTVLGLRASMDPAADDTALWEWCSRQSVVEIGGGPCPGVAAGWTYGKGWARAAACDPLAEAYAVCGLMPSAASRVLCIACPGEAIPLPPGSADLVIIENCLDHVADTARTVGQISRLLKPGGLLWLLVDIMDYSDHMHPHPMTEQRLRSLMSDQGITIRHYVVHDQGSHPEAKQQVRLLGVKVVPAGS